MVAAGNFAANVARKSIEGPVGRRLRLRHPDVVEHGFRLGLHARGKRVQHIGRLVDPTALLGGRFSAGRKREVVMRLLRGEDLESVSRAVGITAARASHWRAQFLAAGQAGLKSRAPDARDEDHRRLQAKIGELLMETELLYAKVDQLEAGGPLARRRSTR